MPDDRATDSDPRHIRTWKCQVSVGELYRWILAKLSDKDIKRALHKYRELMPRQSDWNRKLTQATSVPELGFRYLYRCGQIDESNHRTMQKMLKYIDRQDVLPYFDTILYNTNYSNTSMEDLQKALLDRVSLFLQWSSALTEDEVHPEPPYEVLQCQPNMSPITRSKSKRKSDPDLMKCATVVKRMRFSVGSLLSSSSSSSSTSSSGASERAEKRPRPNQEQLYVEQCCKRARSSIMASALSGPVMDSLLSTSLTGMLSVLQTTLKTVIFGPPECNRATAVAMAANGGGAGGQIFAPVPPLHDPDDVDVEEQLIGFQLPNLHPESHKTHIIPSAGGVGLSTSTEDAVMRYYCSIKLRICKDFGPLTEGFPNIPPDPQDPLGQQMETFSRALVTLRQRPMGQFICQLRFTQLDHLEAFWSDYQSGVLKQVLMDMLACPMARSYVGQFPEGFDDNAPGGSEAAGPSGSQQPSPMQAAIQSALLNVSSIDGLLSLLSQPAQEQESSRSKAMSSLKMSPYNWMFYSAFGGAVPKDTWHTPMELLADVMDKVRRIDRGPLNIQRFPQSLDLNLYVSRRDYENGRLLLMRNLRSMPSLCRFVYHSVLTQVGSQQTSSQTPSFSSPSPGPSTSARTPREVRRRSSTLSVTPRS